MIIYINLYGFYIISTSTFSFAPPLHISYILLSFCLDRGGVTSGPPPHPSRSVYIIYKYTYISSPTRVIYILSSRFRASSLQPPASSFFVYSSIYSFLYTKHLKPPPNPSIHPSIHSSIHLPTTPPLSETP